MSGNSLQIGELAALAKVSVDTVRYYERLNLLPRAARTRSGFRIFPAETVERVCFIKQAQEIGLSLGEIKQLFSTRGTTNECRNVRSQLLEKLADLEARIKQMQSFKKILAHHLAACEAELKAHGDEGSCPVLVTIEKSEDKNNNDRNKYNERRKNISR